MNRTAWSAMSRCRRRDHGDAAQGRQKKSSGVGEFMDALIYLVAAVVILYFSLAGLFA